MWDRPVWNSLSMSYIGVAADSLPGAKRVKYELAGRQEIYEAYNTNHER